MQRRQFITLLGGAAAWPLAARAQQPDRLRRIGVLMAFGENDPEGKGWLSKFAKGLEELERYNAQLDVRRGAGNPERISVLAKELVSLQPDVILSHGTLVTRALQRETRTIPIVFVTVGDPVGDGYVAGLPRPGGNLTGFIFVEAEMGGKWLELLKTMAPNIKRAAAVFNPDTAPRQGTYYLPSFEAAARLLKVEPIIMPVHSGADIESGMTSLGHDAEGGFVATGDPFLLIDRGSTIALAARNKVPAIYFQAVFAREGGLLSYGPDNGDIFRRAALYVDRILRGTNPSELPVQVPIKFEMVVNTRTAKALGLNVPQSILLSADEVIE